MISALVRIVAVIILSIGFTVHAGLADYQYEGMQPEIAQAQLINDIQHGTVDFSALGQAARAKILQNLYGSYAMVMQLGPLQKICPTLIVAFKNGRRFAFRSEHVYGKADWDVWVTSNPEIVEDFVLLPVRGGPPAILPPLGQGENLLPSVDLDCSHPQTRQASLDELTRACQQWPRMCS
jgi:hypothetical protein